MNSNTRLVESSKIGDDLVYLTDEEHFISAAIEGFNNKSASLGESDIEASIKYLNEVRNKTKEKNLESKNLLE
jgi:hypothetical protein